MGLSKSGEDACFPFLLSWIEPIPCIPDGNTAPAMESALPQLSLCCEEGEQCVKHTALLHDCRSLGWLLLSLLSGSNALFCSPEYCCLHPPCFAFRGCPLPSYDLPTAHSKLKCKLLTVWALCPPNWNLGSEKPLLRGKVRDTVAFAAEPVIRNKTKLQLRLRFIARQLIDCAGFFLFSSWWQLPQNSVGALLAEEGEMLSWSHILLSLLQTTFLPIPRAALLEQNERNNVRDNPNPTEQHGLDFCSLQWTVNQAGGEETWFCDHKLRRPN